MMSLYSSEAGACLQAMIVSCLRDLCATLGGLCVPFPLPR
jgi:hypothetical protein